MGIDYFGLVTHLVVGVVSVMTFWKAAGMEGQGDWTLEVVWGGMSAVVFLGSWLILGLGWPGLIGGQVLLLVGIGVVRAIAYTLKTRE